MKVMSLLLFILVWGLFMTALVQIELRSDKKRRRDVARMLSSAQVEVDDDTFQGLLRYARRRVLWSGVGGGVGMAIGLIAIEISATQWPDSYVIGMASFLVGLMLGKALSGWTRYEVAVDAPRVASLRPQGLDDYLLRREIVAEAAALGLGIAGLLTVAVLFLTHTVAASVGSAGATLSAIVILISTLGFVLQRRVLHAPIRAETPAHLVGYDLRLARSVRDLRDMVLGILALAVYLMLTLVGTSLVIPLLFVLVYAAVWRWAMPRELVPSKTPVAHALSGWTVTT